MRERLAADFARFGESLPTDWPACVRERYRIDLTAEYLGVSLPHPIGKGSGQLSLRLDQLETDAEAGLAFVVLKTVVGEDAEGRRTMGAWAVHETRMAVERRTFEGREGWTVTWRGRGWDRPFAEYLDLVRGARALTRGTGMLTIPSVKLHLPPAGAPFASGEYARTIGDLAEAWGQEPLLVEKDFSPTLAGNALADERVSVLRWIEEVPALIRASAPRGARVALKLMNARFDDAFQREMLAAAAHSADAVTVFNRLWDAERQVAYGGWELSGRNLRVLKSAPVAIPRSGTGNVESGRMIVEYARRGCTSVQLHTGFQLPLREYPASAGSRTARTLHRLVFHPETGLIAALLELEAAGALVRRDGELRFLDLARGAS